MAPQERARRPSKLKALQQTACRQEQVRGQPGGHKQEQVQVLEPMPPDRIRLQVPVVGRPEPLARQEVPRLFLLRLLAHPQEQQRWRHLDWRLAAQELEQPQVMQHRGRPRQQEVPHPVPPQQEQQVARQKGQPTQHRDERREQAAQQPKGHLQEGQLAQQRLEVRQPVGRKERLKHHRVHQQAQQPEGQPRAQSEQLPVGQQPVGQLKGCQALQLAGHQEPLHTNPVPARVVLLRVERPEQRLGLRLLRTPRPFPGTALRPMGTKQARLPLRLALLLVPPLRARRPLEGPQRVPVRPPSKLQVEAEQQPRLTLEMPVAEAMQRVARA